jgi:hypothetical protein
MERLALRFEKSFFRRKCILRKAVGPFTSFAKGLTERKERDTLQHKGAFEFQIG